MSTILGSHVGASEELKQWKKIQKLELSQSAEMQ
jgi:hypothetical protein